jgi:hypothetical protein
VEKKEQVKSCLDVLGLTKRRKEKKALEYAHVCTADGQTRGL